MPSSNTFSGKFNPLGKYTNSLKIRIGMCKLRKQQMLVHCCIADVMFSSNSGLMVIVCLGKLGPTYELAFLICHNNISVYLFVLLINKNIMFSSRENTAVIRCCSDIFAFFLFDLRWLVTSKHETLTRCWFNVGPAS